MCAILVHVLLKGMEGREGVSLPGSCIGICVTVIVSKYLMYRQVRYGRTVGTLQDQSKT